VRDALQTQVGIVDAQVHIQSNVVIAQPPTGHAIPLERIAMAVARAGYKSVDLTVDAAGSYETVEGRTMFRIAGWPTTYEITNVSDQTSGEQRIKAKVITEGGVAKLEVMER
jgi:hypothetical protein